MTALVDRATGALVRSPRRRRPTWSLGRTLTAVVLAVPCIYPLVYLVSVSVASAEDYQVNRNGIPRQLDLQRIGDVWVRIEFGQAVLNSLQAVGVGVLVMLLVSSLGAYWFHVHRTLVAQVLFQVAVVGMTVPVVAMIIPLFVLFSQAGLLNELWALGLVYGAINTPFGLFFLTAYYRSSLPNELLEAARMDGAGRLREYWSIVLPLSRPALGALAALGFVWTWGDLLMSLVLVQTPALRTVTVAVSALATGRFNDDAQLAATGALLALLPLIVIFLFAQRTLQRGVLAGIGK